MRVLVIGSGAREHALCLALAADPAVTALVCAPGNAGTAAVAEQRGVDPLDPAAVAGLAAAVQADLVVIGPEAPLVAGVADAVRARGIACFGPSAAAAQLEGSKAFAKDVMAAAGVATARAFVCTNEAEAKEALVEFGPPYVVKDDGLAAGKGVVVTEDFDEALAHAIACGRVVIEEFLDGPEVSLFCITDGATVVPLLPAQDFKRIGDGDTGPNTGGMGAYAPLSWLPAGFTEDIVATVARPTIAAMAARGTPFTGLLYIGLALTRNGPRVVEFNARFGDPETQVVLALLETPLAGLLHAAATATLNAHPPLTWRDGAAVTVVIAAAGYPGPPRGGDVITGSEAPGVIHAGTRRRDDGAIVSNGGRVLSITATGDDLARARQAAYDLTATVALPGGQYRSDIALNASASGCTLRSVPAGPEVFEFKVMPADDPAGWPEEGVAGPQPLRTRRWLELAVEVPTKLLVGAAVLAVGIAVVVSAGGSPRSTRAANLEPIEDSHLVALSAMVASAQSPQPLRDFAVPALRYPNCPGAAPDERTPSERVMATLADHLPGFTLRDSATGRQLAGICSVEVRARDSRGTIVLVTVAPRPISDDAYVVTGGNDHVSSACVVARVYGWRVEIGATGRTGRLPTVAVLSALAVDAGLRW